MAPGPFPLRSMLRAPSDGCQYELIQSMLPEITVQPSIAVEFVPSVMNVPFGGVVPVSKLPFVIVTACADTVEAANTSAAPTNACLPSTLINNSPVGRETTRFAWFRINVALALLYSTTTCNGR